MSWLHGYQYTMAQFLEGFAAIALTQGNLTKASVLIGAAEALTEAIGRKPSPGEPQVLLQDVAAVRLQVGKVAFTEGVMAGRAMSLEQAVTYALASRE